jgi:hypothetical protein
MAESGKVLVVLGSSFKKKSLVPRPLLKARLDYALREFSKGGYSSIIVCGGHTHFSRSHKLPSEAEIMKKYLVENGISSRRVRKEVKSKNTVGNLIFLQELLPKNKLMWPELHLVANKFFLPRVNYLAKMILGERVAYSVHGCQNKMKPNFIRWLQFSERFWRYKCYPKFFVGVKPGDVKTISKRLAEKNKWYPQGYAADYSKLLGKYTAKFGKANKPRRAYRHRLKRQSTKPKIVSSRHK